MNFPYFLLHIIRPDMRIDFLSEMFWPSLSVSNTALISGNFPLPEFRPYQQTFSVFLQPPMRRIIIGIDPPNLLPKAL